MSARHSSPHMPDVYGRSLGEKYGVEDAPGLVTRSLPSAEIGVTELCVVRPMGRLSDSLPRADAYMISLQLSDLPMISYWEEGRHISNYAIRAGEFSIHDLTRDPAAVIDKPLHSLMLFIPVEAFNALADQANVRRMDELRFPRATAIADETVKHMGMTLLSALQRPGQVSQLFVDYATLALVAHMAQTYGGMQALPRMLKGGLASWQERLSKEMIGGDLTGKISLREVAAACGLSVSHFSRAFHKSTGFAPYDWMLQMRTESAKAMLRKRESSLAEIATACGFGDQSHFTRAFTRRVGLSPGAWRKTVFDQLLADTASEDDRSRLAVPSPGHD
jgi:AraC family transcriptional regulator